MPKKERAEKAAAIAMSKELDSEMTEEERARKEKSGMGLFGGVNKGEEQLFGPKMTKEEKKAAAEAKRAELAAKKAAKKGLAGDTTSGSESGMSRTASALDISDLEYSENYSGDAEPKAKAKGKGKDSKKPMKTAIEDELESADTGGDLQKLDEGTLKFAVCTGNLASRKDSRDVKIQSFSISLFGKQLFEDQSIELTYGHRYGLVAQNGSGKSTLLKCLATRQVPIPDFIDIWYLDKEADPSDRTALESVIDTVRNEKERLEKLEENIMSEEGPDDPRLEAIYEKLDRMDPTTFDKRAGELLFGLGFSQTMMARQTKDMSGGWRMRVALAQALFVAPMLLILDEPTNHLDLGACVWLEDYLSKWESILMLTSHSADFLNGVCSKILHLTVRHTLDLYTGNYATYVKTRADHEVRQMKAYEKEQDDIKHLKEFISSCGTYSNLVKQAQSKQKIIDKMVEAGLTEKPCEDPKFRFAFPNSTKIPPPVLAFQNVSFAYSGKKEDYLYTGLEFGIDCDSRIALVGPNGAGKSTLLKLMEQEIVPTEGDIRRNPHLRIGRYNQHSEDVLDLEKDPLTFMQSLYPEGIVTTSGLQKMDVEAWRAKLGLFGVTGEKQTIPIKTMSPGFRARLVFCLMSLRNPHMLLLDEPTNPLDMDMIDSLALAIKNFAGGLVLVSHDFRLLEQVADTIWVCDEKKITPWKGDIQSYKDKLRKDMAKASAKMFTGSGVQ
jgi:ATP-binding cassette subfamily F protein 2